MVVRVRDHRKGGVGTGGTPGSPTGDPGGLSAESAQFFDRLVTLPSPTRQGYYSTLIDGLVSAGVWAKLDALYVYATADVGQSFVNLVQTDPIGGFIQVTGIPTFTTDRGYSGCGAPTQKSIDSGFLLSAASKHYTQNDAMICAWQIGGTQENATLVVQGDGGSQVELYPKWSTGSTFWAINGTGTEITSTAPSSSAGFWVLQRTGASACEIRNNDVSIATSTNASATPPSLNLLGTAVSNNIGVMGIGASLTSGQSTALYSGLQTYLTAIGAI